MLQIGEKVIQNDDYAIKRLYSGVDELLFEIGVSDRDIAIITEEAIVKETVYGQTYAIKAIDRGKKTESVRCILDLDDFKATQYADYSNESDTFAGTVTGVLPSGWTLDDQTGSTISRTIKGSGVTPYEVVDACRSTYSVVYQFDNDSKVLHAYAAGSGSYVGAFVSEDLNLREINYKGKSTDFYTVLRARGANGLTFADINGGLDYIENHQYSSKMIWAFWKDERYEDAASLLAAATSMLYDASKPARSYDCDIVDLKKTDPEKYASESFDLFSRVKLIDKDARTAITAEVAQYIEYPYAPERNEITLDTATPDIYTQVQYLTTSLSNPNSDYQKSQAAAITNSTAQILSGTGGYVVMHTNAENRVYEILIMDTPDILTATKVWRWNSGGLGYSSTGYAGTYATAITQDGAIVADFIATGTLNAALINVINLVAQKLVADSPDNEFTVDIQEALIKVLEGEYIRSAMLYSTTGQGGAFVALKGNVTYGGPGTTIASGMQDDAARFTYVGPDFIQVGYDRNNVRHGAMYCQDVTATNLNITAVRPLGNNLLNVDWRLVRMADGTTAYALVQKA